jgi:hypothetical protein
MGPKLMTAKCGKVSNSPHVEMHQKLFEIPIWNICFVPKLKSTGDVNLVDWCSDLIRMYSLTVRLLNFRNGYCTTVNHFKPYMN